MNLRRGASFWKPHALLKVLESRLIAKRIEPRLDLHEYELPCSFGVGLFEHAERGVHLAQTDVHESQLDNWNIFALRAATQFVQYATCFGIFAGHSVRVSQPGLDFRHSFR